ncbi:MAG: glycosyltransferase [Pseudonocardia sp.]
MTAAAAPTPTTSVVICSHSMRRFDDLTEAVASVRAQTLPAEHTVVVIDHDPELLDRARRAFPGVTIVPNGGPRGASGARNTGIDLATTDLVAFLDDDAVAAPDWLHHAVPRFADPAVIGLGGTLTPLWSGTRPRWFPEEFLWAVGASYRGLPERAAPVRNVWSGNMVVRREVCRAVGGFRAGFGKAGDRSRPEDTEFCIRAARAFPDGMWLFEPAAMVGHKVPPARATPRFFLTRCYAEGLGKADLGGLVGAGRATSAERAHLRTLGAGTVRELRSAAVRRDVAALARAGAIVAGTAAAAAGLLVGTAAARRVPGRASAAPRPVPHEPAPHEAAPHEPAAAPFRPVLLIDVDVVEALPEIAATGPDGRRYGRADVLVRMDTEPLGILEVPLDGDCPATSLATRIWARFGRAITTRATEAGTPAPDGLPIAGLTSARPTRHRRERAAALAQSPPISVVLCTRDPDDAIVACLDSLARQEYPEFEVVVVDNAPTSARVAQLVADRPGVRRVVEPRPGIAWARNCGWRAARHPVVAYIDDDEVADPHWLAEIARAFASRPDVRAVAGLILPAALDTRAQDWFEQFGGHSKGRGFTPALFDRASHAVQHPLYPLPPFGATGNLAVHRATLAQLGGFDVALGSGTPARGSEDTALICDIMLAGHTLAYQPSALVRHHHHADPAGIARQLHGYGVGIGAFYTHAVLRDPRALVRLAALAPRAVTDLLGGATARTATMRADYPRELDRIQRRGMLRGPAAYLRSRRVQRRVQARIAAAVDSGELT